MRLKEWITKSKYYKEIHRSIKIKNKLLKVFKNLQVKDFYLLLISNCHNKGLKIDKILIVGSIQIIFYKIEFNKII